MPEYDLNDGDVLIHADDTCEMIFNITLGTVFDEYGFRCGSFDALPISFDEVHIRHEEGWNILDMRGVLARLWEAN